MKMKLVLAPVNEGVVEIPDDVECLVLGLVEVDKGKGYMNHEVAFLVPTE